MVSRLKDLVFAVGEDSLPSAKSEVDFISLTVKFWVLGPLLWRQLPMNP